MNRQLSKIGFILLLLCGAAQLQAQVTIDIGLDSTTLLIGDQLGVSVNLVVLAGSEVENINYGNWAEAGNVELLDIGELNTVSEGPPTLLHQRLLLTTFDSGYHYFPPLEVVFTQNGVRDTARSGDLAMTVATIPVPQEATIRDNKDIIEEKINWLDLLPFAVGAILVVMLILFLWRLSGIVPERKKTPPPPPKPAHIIALEQLDNLEKEAIWQKGEIKAFQSELTHILRAYLEGRFSMQALEATTAEIRQSMAKFKLDEDGLIHSVLSTADMVKFAKAEPATDVHPAALQTVREFVIATRKPEPAPEEAGEEKDAEE